MARLMCSKDRTEVELVKKHLFKAGIPSEIRSNPLAAALRVSRIELWVQDERDYFRASKLYAGMQARGAISPEPSVDTEIARPREFIDLGEPDAQPDPPPPRAGNGNGGTNGDPPRSEELAEASSLLEKEIEEMLERESELTKTCAALQTREKELSAALSRAQTTLARETEDRAAAEKKQLQEMSGLQSALDRERAERARIEEELARTRRDQEQELKSRDEAVREARKNLDIKSQQLQAQQAAVLELRKELVSQESLCEQQAKQLSKARAEAEAERESRMAAERRAERAETARKSLEAQLAEQTDLQQQVHASAARLNSLRSKLQAKRASTDK